MSIISLYDLWILVVPKYIVAIRPRCYQRCKLWIKCSSGRKFRPICVLVRRLRDLSSEATERLPRSKGYKNHPVHAMAN